MEKKQTTKYHFLSKEVIARFLPPEEFQTFMEHYRSVRHTQRRKVYWKTPLTQEELQFLARVLNDEASIPTILKDFPSLSRYSMHTALNHLRMIALRYLFQFHNEDLKKRAGIT